MTYSRHVLVSVFSVHTFAVLQHVRVSQLLALLAFVSIIMWSLVLASMLIRMLLHSLHHAHRRLRHPRTADPTSTTEQQPVEGGTAWTSEL